ncbi:MAG: hypothetical protein VYC54_13265, partial [Pseudomonadota bacterium]|nr:hypothetical protein [Pseudomonadota bacterium]
SHTLYPQQSATLRMQLAIKVDPRRLEAVESARDPSFLIRAQMQLQAQQKQRPQQSNKEW